MRRFGEENGQYCLSFCREEEGCEGCEEKSREEIVRTSMKGRGGGRNGVFCKYVCVCAKALVGRLCCAPQKLYSSTVYLLYIFTL